MNRLRWVWCWTLGWMLVPALAALGLYYKVRPQPKPVAHGKRVRVTSSGLCGDVPELFDPDKWIDQLKIEYRKIVASLMPEAALTIRMAANGSIGWEPNIRIEVDGADVETAVALKFLLGHHAEIQFVSTYSLTAPAYVFQMYPSVMAGLHQFL